MGQVRFMISEAAKQVDVEAHVLRYWEEELSLNIRRTEMGHRYYTDDDIQLFRCIKKLKDEGMLLRDLKPLIKELEETRLKLKAADHKAGSEACTASGLTVSPERDVKNVKGKLSETPPSSRGDIMIPLNSVDQMRSLIGSVFREILNENNGILKKDISSTVATDVIHEMDFLLQAKDRQQEEHFRKLDALIRQQQANRKESAKANPIMKLRKIFT